MVEDLVTCEFATDVPVSNWTGLVGDIEDNRLSSLSFGRCQ